MVNIDQLWKSHNQQTKVMISTFQGLGKCSNPLSHDQTQGADSTKEKKKEKKRVLSYHWVILSQALKSKHQVNYSSALKDQRKINVYTHVGMMVSSPGLFFLAAKYGGRTCGWCICNQPPTTGSPSVFCSQKK
jgi:hypothetical protein